MQNSLISDQELERLMVRFGYFGPILNGCPKNNVECRDSPYIRTTWHWQNLLWSFGC